MNYWAKNPVRTEQKRKRYINKLIELEENKPTSEKGSRRIAYIINKKLKDDGKKITIHKATICRILNKELGKPRKIKRTFFLSKENKKRRVEFCQKMLSRKIKGNQILFTDETAIDMGSYTNDSIRLSKENREKLRKGEKEAFDLINREEKKFEPKIMVAGGISSVGLTDLIISERNTQ